MTTITHTTTKYDHLIDVTVSGPALDPLTAHSGDIYGVVHYILGITDTGRLAVQLTNSYQITIDLRLAQSSYFPDYTRATADVALPTGGTATMDSPQVMALMRRLAGIRAGIDPAFNPDIPAGATRDVPFPDGATLTMNADQIGAAITDLAQVYGQLTTQDTDLRDQARAAHFAS